MKRPVVCLFLILAMTAGFLLLPRNSGYIEIPVEFYPSERSPVLNIEVEGQKLHVLIDLGANKLFSLRKEVIDRIKNKKLSKPMTSYDLKGNSYPIQSYIVRRIKIEDLNLKDLTITVDSVDFLVKGGDPHFETNKKTSDLAQKRANFLDGSIGRNLLKKWNCFFDFPNQIIYLIDKKRKEVPFTLAGFTKIPFEMHKYGILISLNSDLGSHKFILDTGSTHSSIRESIVDPSNPEEFIPRAYITDSVFIGGKALGEWQFSLRRISDTFKEFDGILGADFFLKHAIYLDFTQKIAYIRLEG